MKEEPVREKDGMTRRDFLALSGWLALGFTTLGTPLAAEAVRFNPELVKVTGGRTAMGTYVNMILFHPSKDQAQEAMEKAYSEMSRLIDIFNCHDGSTPVGFLNRTGNLKDLPPELSEVLTSSVQFHQTTAGAFDITVKPLLDLYAQCFREHQRAPEKADVGEALKRVGIRNLALDNGSVAFKQERMAVTLDGIAKGYIVDRSMDVLRSCGIRHALINAGGDISVTGPQGDGSPWNIGIQNPWNPQGTIDVIPMTQGAVATSGSYEVYFDREKLYHHIISPRAGGPVSGPVSVSVIAPDAMTADALSTSVFVMGPGKGKAFLKSLPSTAGLIVASDQRMLQANWPGKAV